MSLLTINTFFYLKFLVDLTSFETTCLKLSTQRKCHINVDLYLSFSSRQVMFVHMFIQRLHIGSIHHYNGTKNTFSYKDPKYHNKNSAKTIYCCKTQHLFDQTTLCFHLCMCSGKRQGCIQLPVDEEINHLERVTMLHKGVWGNHPHRWYFTATEQGPSRKRHGKF